MEAIESYGAVDNAILTVILGSVNYVNSIIYSMEFMKWPGLTSTIFLFNTTQDTFNITDHTCTQDRCHTNIANDLQSS